MATKHPPDSLPPADLSGRQPALKPKHIAALRDIVTERAQSSLHEIAEELHRRCGVRVCDATIRRALRAQGIVRLKPVRGANATTPAKGAKRYGYTAAHRREDVSPYSTNLTDAEWDLVADLVERSPGQRGTPAHYSRRKLVDACCYTAHRLCLAAIADGVSALARGLQSVFTLGYRRCVRENAGPVARAVAFTDGTPKRADCGDH